MGRSGQLECGIHSVAMGKFQISLQEYKNQNIMGFIIILSLVIITSYLDTRKKWNVLAR